MAVSSAVKIGIGGIIGAILCAAGAVFLIQFPRIMKTKISEALPIVNGTDLYKAWEEAPIPIYMQYYFYNVTNHEEFLKNSSVKPILQQLGPYTYREYRKKVNISFDEENGTVSYEQVKWFVFEPNMTKGDLNDTITTLNIPLIGLATKSDGQLDFLSKMMINNFIRMFKASIFVTKTIDELLFGGYRDTLMAYLAQKTKRTILPNDTFGIMYMKNNTADGEYTVYTGVDNFDLFPAIAKWNGSSTVPYWNDTYCNMINGTDGSTFKPFLTKDSYIRMFSSELCRSVFMEFDEENEIHGIKTYKFATPFGLLADHTVNPDNECFCLNNDKCLKSGILNISVCKMGAPLMLSPVHFYFSDPTYLAAVEGLNPNKEEHDTIADVEPITGVVVNAARRLQINVAVRPFEHIKLMNNLPEIIFPVFWLNESANIGEERAAAFRNKIYKPILIGKAVTIALFAVGGFVIILCIILAIRCYSQRNKQQQQMDDAKKVPLKDQYNHAKNGYPVDEVNESLLKTQSNKL